MSSRDGRSRGPPTKFSRSKLNPAFASAHGIVSDEDRSPSTSSPSLSTSVARTTTRRQQHNPPTTTDRTRLGGYKHALSAARRSGILQLGGIRLTDEAFDLRRGMETPNLSMDENRSVERVYVEEELTLADLSDVDYSEGLDPRVGEVWVGLTTLRARRCLLRKFPDISALVKLRTLDLTENSLEDNIDNLFEKFPESLREMLASNNRLVTSSETITNGFSSLLTLDLSHNQLERLNLANGIDVPSLQTLRLGDNPSLKELILPSSSPSLTGRPLSDLRCLEAPRCAINHLPELLQCTQLQTVDLSHNYLTEIPLESFPPKVERLNLSHNQLKTLPKEGMIRLEKNSSSSSLVHLMLRGNGLVTFPSWEARALESLQVLDVADNNLKDLPYTLGYCREIRRIFTEGNPLRGALRSRASDDVDVEALKRTLRNRGPLPDVDASSSGVGGGNPTEDRGSSDNPTRLDWSQRGLKKVPSSVIEELRRRWTSDDDNFQTTGLRIRVCKIDHNNLTELPGEFLEAMANLEVLDAGHNHLSTVLPSLTCANLCLQEVVLCANRLTPKALEQAFLSSSSSHSRLRRLDLSSNALDCFPWNRMAASLPELRELDLSHNLLERMAINDYGEGEGEPNDCNDCLWPHLTSLRLSSNRLTDVGSLPLDMLAQRFGGSALTSLDLSDNQLSKIPLEFGLLEDRLRTFDVRGNPQRAVRAALLERGPTAVLAHLRSRMTPAQLEAATTRSKTTTTTTATTTTTSTLPANQFLLLEPPGPTSTRAERKRDGNVPERTNDGNVDGCVNASVTVDLEALRAEVTRLSDELEQMGLSQARKYAVKKSLAMTRAKILREERIRSN